MRIRLITHNFFILMFLNANLCFFLDNIKYFAENPSDYLLIPNLIFIFVVSFLGWRAKIVQTERNEMRFCCRGAAYLLQCDARNNLRCGSIFGEKTFYYVSLLIRLKTSETFKL